MSTYELPDGFQGMETAPKDTRVNVLYASGEIKPHSTSFLYLDTSPYRIGWAPIVPPKKKRWRAERNETYWFVTTRSTADYTSDYGDSVDDARYNLGNYFQTRDEAIVVAVKIKTLFNEVAP